MNHANYYMTGHHEAASKFNGQKFFRPKIQQPSTVRPDRLIPIRPVQSGGGRELRAKPMKRLTPAIVSAIVVIASPGLVRTALAQTKLTPKPATARAVDNCAPIGRTANGTLVYSMKCDNLPTPAPPPQAEAAPAPPPEPEVQRTGIFGLSYTRKQPDQ
jgi:hypothetical protein